MHSRWQRTGVECCCCVGLCMCLYLGDWRTAVDSWYFYTLNRPSAMQTVCCLLIVPVYCKQNTMRILYSAVVRKQSIVFKGIATDPQFGGPRVNWAHCRWEKEIVALGRRSGAHRCVCRGGEAEFEVTPWVDVATGVDQCSVRRST